LEFAGLCHNGYMQERVFPLFIDYFFNDDCRKKMMNALVDDPLLIKRVEKNTGKQLSELLETARSEYMDNLAGHVHKKASEHQDNQFETFIKFFLEKIEEYNKKRFQEHTRRLTDQVCRKLNYYKLKEFLRELAEGLECNAEASACAVALFAGDPLDGIASLIQAGKDSGLALRTTRLFQEIVGLLLVSTIDPTWWLLNEFRLQHSLSTGDGVKVGDMFSHEIEIVMAKLSDRPALYSANSSEIEPQQLIGDGNGFAFTGDKDERKKFYLKAFYIDITKADLGPAIVSDGNEQMRQLKGRLKNNLAQGRQYFYILSRTEFDELSKLGVIKEINEELEKMVQFIVVGKDDDSEPNGAVLSVDSERVLGYLSEILH